MLELSCKTLYVDQQMPKSDFQTKLAFYRHKVKSDGISELGVLSLSLFEDTTEEDFKAEVRQLFGKTSQYVHPSIQQISERIKLQQSGITLGFDNVETLKGMYELAFEVYSAVLVFYFHAIGPSFTGDLMQGFVDQDGWIFHRSRFVSEIDRHYDYKFERQGRLHQIQERRTKRLSRD